MCASSHFNRALLDVATAGTYEGIRQVAGPGLEHITDAPALPGMPPPLPPAGAPQQTATDLWAPAGQKDAQALAGRLGTNALVVPFQSLNVA